MKNEGYFGRASQWQMNIAQTSSVVLDKNMPQGSLPIANPGFLAFKFDQS